MNRRDFLKITLAAATLPALELAVPLEKEAILEAYQAADSPRRAFLASIADRVTQFGILDPAGDLIGSAPMRLVLRNGALHPNAAIKSIEATHDCTIGEVVFLDADDEVVTRHGVGLSGVEFNFNSTAMPAGSVLTMMTFQFGLS